MKRILLLLAVFSMVPTFGQNKLSPEGRIFFHEMSQYFNREDGKKPEVPASFYESYDITFQKGKPCIGAIALVDKSLDNGRLSSLGISVGSRMGDLLSVRVALEQFTAFLSIPEVRYVECGGSADPYLERARYSLRSDSVYMGLGDLKMPYTGKGVIIAIIDWGFDYSHPVFYDTSMQNYRVSRAWDQNKYGGPAPSGFTFGTEYIGKDQLLQAKEDTLYVFGPMSHGTHVAGIAGGAGAGTRHRGIAPESELIFISLRRDAASFVDAINYINRYADSVGKPYVVNMSFGNFRGPNDGSSLKNKVMDELAGNGKIFVASAGNNGGQTFHLYNDFSSIDTLITEVPNANGLSEYWGESINSWADSGKSFSIQLELADAGNNPVFVSDWMATGQNLSLYDTLYKNNGDTLILLLVSEEANLLNNKPNLYFESRKLGALKLILRVKGTGPTHLWHVAKLQTRVTNWGQPFRALYPGAVQGDARNGIGGPPGVGREVITVASHLGEVLLPNGSETGGTLSSYTSEGPLVDGRRKPDVSGPGQSVASSVNSYDPLAGDYIETVNFNGRDYGFVRYSGTSMSGPAVAGVVALMLQAHPNLHAREVKDILWATIRLDNNTGVIGEEGHTRWGRGKVNAYAAVRMAEIKTGSTTLREKAPFSYYPNPVRNKVLQIDSDRTVNLKVLNMQGQELIANGQKQGSFSLDLSKLSPGAYLLEWQSGNDIGWERLVVE